MNSNRPSPLSLTLLAALLVGTPALATNFPITEQQRSTAEQVAQSGVPLDELAPDAPDSYTIKSGDTLWAISKIFLKSPWRWPELWGMNKDQIANPHLIYPGQTLMLVKKDGRATLQIATPVSIGPDGQGKLKPRVRASDLVDNPVAAIPQHLIEPFLNEAVVLETDELAKAPRIVATQEGRVLVSRGEVGYVRGIQQPQENYRVFRAAKPLLDPDKRTVLGYESVYLGNAALTALGGQGEKGGSKYEIPATVTVQQARLEITTGDRLAPVPPRTYSRYVPHAPLQAINGRVISIYGDAITGGQNQIVSLNRGTDDGMERGHVLALWRAGKVTRDLSGVSKGEVLLPDEKHGVLFVFQTFKKVSYALIISVKDPVSTGDRFSQP